MNKTQTQLINFLNSSIHAEKKEYSLSDMDWEQLLEEARAHNIQSLVYTGIDNKTLLSINKQILEKWKKETFLSGVYQLSHINQISYVLNELDKKNIPVIVLKGLVLRDLYPQSELRTMSDADILVKEENLEKLRTLLLELGYEESGKTLYHLNFEKENSEIEVHWNISSEEHFKGVTKYVEHIWENAIEVKIGQSKALSMNYEDLATYLCMHMAKHLRSCGFGIRQLCDFVLLVEQKGNLIDWNKFIEETKKFGIDKFSVIIFKMCKKLFGLNIPKEVEDYTSIDEVYLDILIDEILDCGVHGKRDENKILGKNAAYTLEKKENSTLIKFIKFMFPSSKYLDESKYGYAKKNKILLPVAWIHRAFTKERKFSQKFRFILFGFSVAKKKEKLLKWLEI
ncbi:nucleotidyltransferase domain-containing protein [Romboutsia sp.]|uniref:nucleotidyltransferase domain-containing protein n=1 Tax=Romboutsia sp. TaxID=1965302 RepID=UPI003F3B6A0B